MTHSQTLKRQFAIRGIELHLDRDVATLLDRGIRHKLEAGRLSLQVRTCQVCGLELTDPDSIIAGAGPECRKIATAERDTGERFPVGCEVRIPEGFYAGRIGIVEAYTPRKGRVAYRRPFRVTFASAIDPSRRIFEMFAADELERLEVDA